MERETEPVRTDMYCTSCGGNFIAMIDYRLDGQHEIECPHCGHPHYRDVLNGQVTGDRWKSDTETHRVPKRDVWKAVDQPIQAHSGSHFLRERWLNRSST